jgi:hypothetical protein
VEYRAALAIDAAGIGGFHADSWSPQYRGAHLDSFLDGDVFADSRDG